MAAPFTADDFARFSVTQPVVCAASLAAVLAVRDDGDTTTGDTAHAPDAPAGPALPTPALTAADRARLDELERRRRRATGDGDEAPAEPPLDFEEEEERLSLATAAARDEARFHEAVRAWAVKDAERYLGLDADAAAAFEAHRARAVARVASLPRFYSLHATAGLAVGQPTARDPAMRLEAALRTPRVRTVDPAAVEAAVASAGSVGLRLMVPVDGESSPSAPIWDDPVAAALATEHNAHVVLCGAALATLVDNQAPSFPVEWDLPVRVRGVDGGHGDRRVAYVGKPLPPRRMPPRAPAGSVFRRALRSRVLQPTAAEAEVAGEADGDTPDAAYSLWTFGALRLLVRCRVRAFVRDGAAEGKTRPFHVVARAEYLPSLGLEEESWSDAARAWLAAFIRPESRVLLGRVSAHDALLLRVEQRDAAGTLAATPSFRPAHAMRAVHALLEHFAGFPEGTYLASHGAGEAHVAIHRAEAENSADVDAGESPRRSRRGRYDLHALYAPNALAAARRADAAAVTANPPYLPLRHVTLPGAFVRAEPSPDELPSTQRSAKGSRKRGRSPRGPMRRTRAASSTDD